MGSAMTTRRDGHTPKTFAQSCVITEMISGQGYFSAPAVTVKCR
jgi:hypothetical protein